MQRVTRFEFYTTLGEEPKVGHLPIREQVQWRAREMNEWAERNPRGRVQYLVRPAAKPDDG